MTQKLLKMIEAIKDKPSWIAKKAGISQGNLSATLNGKRPPTYDMLVKIAQAYKEINPLFVMYEGEHPVLRKDEDFFPYMYKDTREVIDELKGSISMSSYMDFLWTYGLEEFRGYAIPDMGYDEDGFDEEDYHDVLAYIDEGFSLENLKSLHENFPEYNIFWMMGRDGKKFDKPYALLQRGEQQLGRKVKQLDQLVDRMAKELEETRDLVTDKEVLAAYIERRKFRDAEQSRLLSELVDMRKRIRQLYSEEGDHKKEVSEINDQIKQAEADLAKVEAEIYTKRWLDSSSPDLSPKVP